MNRMSTQLITLHGHVRAICTARRVFLVDETAPDTPFVLAMSVYATAILDGQLPGPYQQARARAYARALLIPAELLEPPRQTGDPEPVAVWLGVPVDELQVALCAQPRMPLQRRGHRLAGRRRRRPRSRPRRT